MQHVLIVDDEPSTRNVLRLYLERAGMQVATAADLTEALARFDERKPDVALCDWRLGEGASGIEVVRALRKRSGELPILVMTGMATDDVIDQVLELGLHARSILLKPFRASELVARIRESVDLA